MRIVLDSNILCRACAPSTGPAFELLHLVRENSDCILVLSRYILAEVRGVLSRDYFRVRRGVTEGEIERFCQALLDFAEVVEPTVGPPVIVDDPDDDQILFTAVAGEADVICTLDRHFYSDRVQLFCEQNAIRIVDEVQLVAELRRLR